MKNYDLLLYFSFSNLILYICESQGKVILLKKRRVNKMEGLLLGMIVATLGWFITGFLDLSWIAELFGKLF